MKTNSPHIPVLFNEVIDIFKDINNGYVIDCTLGYGGHSIGILSSNKNINLICNDQDNEAINYSKERLSEYNSRIIFNKDNFKNIINKFKHLEIRGILADIGVSSLQLDKKQRGFGFKSDKLDMRMDTNATLTAKEVVNNYSQKDLKYIFKEYGEIREYKKITNLIIQNRPFQSATELSTLFEKNLYKNKIHPATLPFQAIRIEVNKELDVLNQLFYSIKDSKITNCIVAIISFHSLEDRIVKNNFKLWSKKCICPSNIMKCQCGNNNNIGKIVTKKPITASKDELNMNIRSRSAKMRVFKID